MAGSGFNIFNVPFVSAILGLTPGADMLYVPSQRRGIGGSPQDLVEGPDDRYQGFLDWGVAEELTITSDDAGDTAAGAGCQRVFVQGLDADRNVQSRAYETNGLAGVVTVGDVWSRVWRMRSLRVAPGNRLVPNIGNLSARSAAPGNPLMAFMSAGMGSTLGSNFTMPAKHTGVAVNVSGSTNNGQIAEIHLKGALATPDNNAPYNLGVTLSADQGPDDLPVLFSVPPGTDVIADAMSAGGNTDVFLSYTVYVVSLASIGDPAASPLFGAPF